MSSISLRTPIVYDSADGFGMIKTLPQLVRQNLKMLILTNPGERVMDPDFGVGIQRYLFSNFSENYQSKITNSASFRIVYYLPNIGTSDLLEITI